MEKICHNCKYFRAQDRICDVTDEYKSETDTCSVCQVEDTIDWEQRRYEIAKDAVNGILAAPVIEGVDPNPTVEYIAKKAVIIADALISELKKEKQ